MNEMKLFKEDGFPTEDGLKTLLPIKRNLEALFDSELVAGLSIAQTRLLGSYLSKVIGTAVLNVLVKK